MAVQVLTYDGLKYTVDLIQDKIDGVVCDMASSTSSLSDSFKELSCRVDELERAFSEMAANLAELQNAIRPVPDATTENPNQKGDLEILSQIETNPFFPGFVDLDSPEYLQQRPTWDFNVDF